jgi:hypothetical protein
MAQDTAAEKRLHNTIIYKLEAVRPNGLSRSEIIHGVFGGHVHAYDISCALYRLKAAGKARCENHKPAAGPGRPSEVWFAVQPKN